MNQNNNRIEIIEIKFEDRQPTTIFPKDFAKIVSVIKKLNIRCSFEKRAERPETLNLFQITTETEHWLTLWRLFGERALEIDHISKAVNFMERSLNRSDFITVLNKTVSQMAITNSKCT